MLKAGGRKRLPYIDSIAVSVALIITYIASRTVGVPLIGVVEYNVGRLDMISKILQVIVIGISGFALFNMKKQLSKGVNKLFSFTPVIYFLLYLSISKISFINLFV